MRKIGKKYIENNLAEMLALMGGAMSYCERHGNLNGYDDFYLANKEKDGFHYRMQKQANKYIINEFRKKGVRCSKWKLERFCRYKKSGSKKVENVLYDYFEFIMDYILRDDILTKLMFQYVFQECSCPEKKENGNCLNMILDWQYKRLVKLKTDLLLINSSVKIKEAAKNLLDKLNGYPRFERFRMTCKKIHSAC